MCMYLHVQSLSYKSESVTVHTLFSHSLQTRDTIVITSHNNSGVYLSLNGTVIPNHGYAEIDDIGSTDDFALLCHTNQPPHPVVPNSGGNWFAPNGDRVSGTYVPGFIRVRAPMVVRLQRTSGEPPEGIYRCSVRDDLSELVHVHVGLYNSAQGSIQYLFNDY